MDDKDSDLSRSRGVLGESFWGGIPQSPPPDFSDFRNCISNENFEIQATGGTFRCWVEGPGPRGPNFTSIDPS